jgi:hypothetical protein
MTETTPSPLGNVITIDDERIKSHLDRVVRGSVEETLNALLDAEADRLCNAQRYERSEARRDTRAGHYERKLQIKAGKVSLRIPFGQAPTPGGGPFFLLQQIFILSRGKLPGGPSDDQLFARQRFLCPAMGLSYPDMSPLSTHDKRQTARS